MAPVTHVSVLLQESIDALALSGGEVVVDGTFGGGGHSRVICDHTPQVSRLICVDLDEEAAARFNEQYSEESRAVFVHANFKDAAYICEQSGVESVDRVLLDLGTSTFQLLEDTRGFSFNSEAPLSMSFSKRGGVLGFSADDIVNRWDSSSIADIIYYYGDERKARRIAEAIVAARVTTPITTAKQLAMIIQQVVPRFGKTHPATKTFQALRIAVNDELAVIKEALDAWWARLASGGRIAVITFHSLEDRTVKQWMKQCPTARVITKKPIVPTRAEILHNPRARSAKLRIIEK